MSRESAVKGCSVAWAGVLVLGLCMGCQNSAGPRFLGPSQAPPAGGTPVAQPTPVTLESGVRVTDEVLGKGAPATRGCVVHLHYVGSLSGGESDGKVFDRSEREQPPSRFVLSTGPGGVIAGLVEGVLGMREGGVRIIEIPWQLAYGDQGSGGIPPRADLRFKVELWRVQ